jgi:hypothetical protein
VLDELRSEMKVSFTLFKCTSPGFAKGKEKTHKDVS